jgi:hypothetical protein
VRNGVYETVVEAAGSVSISVKSVGLSDAENISLKAFNFPNSASRSSTLEFNLPERIKGDVI